MLADVEFQCPTVEHEIADEHLVCDLQIHFKYFRRKWNEVNVCILTSLHCIFPSLCLAIAGLEVL